MHVALCLPQRADCKAGYAYDLARLVYASAKAGIDLSFTRGSGTLIHDVRIDLAKNALKHKPDYLLWVDDDMRFPADSLDQLLRRDRKIVGCNYPSRSKGNPQPTARRFTDDGKWELVHTTPLSTGLEEVDALGFGLILIRADVFDGLPDPWFSLPWAPEIQKHVGEDVFFCMNAGARGVPTWLDHDLSKALKHVGPYEYEFADINRNRS